MFCIYISTILARREVFLFILLCPAFVTCSCSIQLCVGRRRVSGRPSSYSNTLFRIAMFGHKGCDASLTDMEETMEIHQKILKNKLFFFLSTCLVKSNGTALHWLSWLIGCFALLHAVGLCVVARSLLSFPFPFHILSEKECFKFFYTITVWRIVSQHSGSVPAHRCRRTVQFMEWRCCPLLKTACVVSCLRVYTGACEMTRDGRVWVRPKRINNICFRFCFMAFRFHSHHTPHHIAACAEQIAALGCICGTALLRFPLSFLLPRDGGKIGEPPSFSPLL